MTVKDLPFKAISGFTGTIKDFIQFEADENGVHTMVINPGRKLTKYIADVSTARRYLLAAISLPFDYASVEKGKHLRTNIQENIGYSENVGVVWKDGQWYTAHAMGKALIPARPLAETRFAPLRLGKEMAIDTMAQVTVKIDVASTGLVQLAKYLQGLLEAPDLPTVYKMRATSWQRRSEGRQTYLAARNAAGALDYERPAELQAIVDQEQVNLLEIPGPIRLMVLTEKGEVKGRLFWNHSNTACALAQRHLAAGLQFATVAAS